ncbi:MAG: arginine--tRNA ligase [Chloroflexota bacterium]
MFSFERDVEDGLREAFAACGVRAERMALRKIPHAESWGYATQLALTQGRGKDGAQALATDVAAWLNRSGRFERAEAANGYVNVYLDPRRAAPSVIAAILAEGDRYGAGDPRGTRVMVEYSQPNTHKEFHIGHLRNTAFGSAVVRLLRFSGFDVLAANYIGDIGAHVIRCLWCLRKYHAADEPPADRLDWLGGIYSESTRRLEEEPDAKAEIADLFARWEAGDADLLALWRQTRQWCLDELERIYRQLDVHFDVWFYESEVEADGKRIAQELVDRGVAEYSEGLPIVRLPGKLGVIPIMRSDGTSLYQTKELALAIRKFREYDIDQAIVVTDVSQSLYFKQVFAVLQLYGFEHARDLSHLAYERVNLPAGKMASRSGNIVAYEDLAREATARVAAIVAEKNPSLPEEERTRVAEQVAVSALKFTMLSVGSTSVITFEWERVLDFDGFSGPYLQYAYVRAWRILERSRRAASAASSPGPPSPSPGPPSSGPALPTLQPAERRLMETMADFPKQVARAADERAPVIVATYVYELARQFSEFYQSCPVIQEPDAAVRALRLDLVACTRQVLANGLTLLGLSLPESM